MVSRADGRRPNGRERRPAKAGYGAVPAGGPDGVRGPGTRADADSSGAAGSERTDGRPGYGAATYGSPGE
ncbi:hypothetical protein [Halosimplex pelagicum]|uniref:Uncharacterized protein n=1 Tax=Halosimplex pelagicum TaxID=869886 RepID=A0A7D5P7V7_9EURY|nr:hypothetical protein [Halosimplex pelagicum]QLH81421.1 hypothetical protein HZS54_07185 [Halosimplex pelagicum]